MAPVVLVRWIYDISAFLIAAACSSWPATHLNEGVVKNRLGSAKVGGKSLVLHQESVLCPRWVSLVEGVCMTAGKALPPLFPHCHIIVHIPYLKVDTHVALAVGGLFPR